MVMPRIKVIMENRPLKFGIMVDELIVVDNYYQYYSHFWYVLKIDCAFGCL